MYAISYIFIPALVNIEGNALLSPHPAPVPLLPGVRVHVGEVTPGAVLGPADLLVDVLLVPHPGEAGWSDLTSASLSPYSAAIQGMKQIASVATMGFRPIQFDFYKISFYICLSAFMKHSNIISVKSKY